MSIAKQTKKQKKPKISSPTTTSTRSLMKKIKKIENKTPRYHIKYVEICETIKKRVKISENTSYMKYEKRLRHLSA